MKRTNRSPRLYLVKALNPATLDHHFIFFHCEELWPVEFIEDSIRPLQLVEISLVPVVTQPPRRSKSHATQN